MWNSFNFVFCIIKHTIGDQPGVVDMHTEYDASIVKKYMSVNFLLQLEAQCYPLVFTNTARIDTGDLDKIRYYR